MVDNRPSSVEDDDDDDKDATSIDSGSHLGLAGRGSNVGRVHNLPMSLHPTSPSTLQGPDCHTCSGPWEGGGPPPKAQTLGQ